MKLTAVKHCFKSVILMVNYEYNSYYGKVDVD